MPDASSPSRSSITSHVVFLLMLQLACQRDQPHVAPKVHEPQLILADEPFGALDALTRIRMQDLLRELCARHQPAVLLVTHDVDEAVGLADRVIVLEDGRISADQQIGLPLPRSHRDPGFLAHRDSLLRALGVSVPSPTHQPEDLV